MNADYFKQKHHAGLAYADYVATGKPQQGENWQKIYEQASLTPEQQRLVGGFERRINVIGISGIWCGDCVQQCPLVQRIAEASPHSPDALRADPSLPGVDLRWLDRDEHMDLAEHYPINAGARVPVFIWLAEDYESVGWYGDRTLSRYRAIAQKQLGGACPLPGAAVPDDELAATLQDWLDQIERVQLLLRLSGRLRKMHGD